MMGERTVAQEPLFYEFRLGSRPQNCGILKAEPASERD